MGSSPELLAPAAPSLGPESHAAVTPASPPGIRLLRYATMAPLQALRMLNSSLHGLDEVDAQARLASHGDNTLVAPTATSRAWRLLGTLTDPFVLILLFLGVVSAATGDLAGVAVICALAVASCGLRFRQEHRADRAAAALRAMVATTTTVLRRAEAGAPPLAREVPTDQLVVGDVVQLSAGEIVPADLRLLRSSDLTVSQALLTGESLPVLKYATLSAAPGDGDGQHDIDATLFDHPRLCLLGSTVVGGSATGLVVATGADTYFAWANRELPDRRADTAFERGVKGVSWTLIRFMVATVPLVLAVNELVQRDWLQACLFAVAVAVGLTPEMLPVVVTSALARASAAMRRHGVIVKRLPAVHGLGAMDVLCIDKTGTLTVDQVSVTCHLDPAGRPDLEPLKYASLNSYFCVEQSGHLVCDTVDEALLRRCEELGLPVEDGFAGAKVLSFDAVRRRATVAVRPDGRWGVELLVTKGAADEVLACCTHVRAAGETVPLDDEHRLRLASLADALHDDGVRVLAVAVRTRPAAGRKVRPADESSMTLIGYVGLLDQVKPSAAPTLRALAQHGTGVKVITGDHPLVAARICRDAGLDPGVPVCGSHIEGLEPAALATLARDTTLFAKVDPQQKAAIVGALRAAGHTVGYLGDGVNDAPALRAADVGICVDSAVDIARESSDVLLVGKDLATLTAGVIAGRHAFANIIKYVKITVSSNVGNVCSVLAACAVLPFLPMLPLQILVQNLLFDISQLSLAFDHTDQEVDRRPRTFSTTDLTRFVIFFGAINGLADLATFAVLRHALGTHITPAGEALFHTGWFVENLLSQLLAVHLLRSRRGVRGWSWAARPVLVTGAGVALLTLLLPITPVGALVELRAMPADYYLWLTAVLAAFSVALVAGKSLYQRIFPVWL